jgi:hypothetical protein
MIGRRLSRNPEQGWEPGKRGAAVRGMCAVVRFHGAWVPAKVASVSLNGTAKTVDLVSIGGRRVLYRRELTGIRVDLRGEVNNTDMLLRALTQDDAWGSVQPRTYAYLNGALEAARGAAVEINEVVRLERRRAQQQARRAEMPKEIRRECERIAKQAYRAANPDYVERQRVAKRARRHKAKQP